MKLIKPVLFWTIQIFVVLGLLEVVCFYFLKTSSNPFYRARRILQQNEIWGWQARPNLNTDFENAPVLTDSNGFRTDSSNKVVDFKKVELLTLGPSSAFGWGVKAEDTYSYKVAKALQLEYLNASQIGFSTVQGSIIWNSLLKDSLPNLKYVILSYGINDLDRFRFFDLSFINDVSYFSEGFDRGKNQFPELNSNLFTTFNLFKNEASLNRNCQALRTIEQRLSLTESVQESLRLIKSLKEKNVKIIFVGTPYLRMPVNETFQYSQIDAYYNQAAAAATAEKCREALDFVKKAKAIEPWRVEHDVVSLSKMHKKLSGDENILFIDSYAAFDLLKEQKDYFVDPVHPSEKGHELIAGLIIEILKQ